MNGYISILQTTNTSKIKIPRSIINEVLDLSKAALSENIGFAAYLYIASKLNYQQTGKLKEDQVIFKVKYGETYISEKKLLKDFHIGPKNAEEFYSRFLKALEFWGIYHFRIEQYGKAFIYFECDAWKELNPPIFKDGFFAQHNGFFFVSRQFIKNQLQILMHENNFKMSEQDAFFDLWFNISVNDPKVAVSVLGPVVSFENPNSLNYQEAMLSETISQRWNWSRSMVNRFINKLIHAHLISRVNIGGRYGSVLFFDCFLYKNYPDVVDYTVPSKDLIREKLNLASSKSLKLLTAALRYVFHEIQKYARVISVFRPGKTNRSPAENSKNVFIPISKIPFITKEFLVEIHQHAKSLIRDSVNITKLIELKMKRLSIPMKS